MVSDSVTLVLEYERDAKRCCDDCYMHARRLGDEEKVWRQTVIRDYRDLEAQLAEAHESIRLFKLEEQTTREDLDSIYLQVIGYTSEDPQDIETTVGAVVDAINTLVRERADAQAERDALRKALQFVAEALGDSDECAVILRRPIPELIRAALSAGEGE